MNTVPVIPAINEEFLGVLLIELEGRECTLIVALASGISISSDSEVLNSDELRKVSNIDY